MRLKDFENSTCRITPIADLMTNEFPHSSGVLLLRSENRKRDAQVLALQRSAMCANGTYRTYGAKILSQIDADVVLR